MAAAATAALDGAPEATGLAHSALPVAFGEEQGEHVGLLQLVLQLGGLRDLDLLVNDFTQV